MGLVVVFVLSCFLMCNPIHVHANTNQNDGEFGFFMLFFSIFLFTTLLSRIVLEIMELLNYSTSRKEKLVIWRSFILKIFDFCFDNI
jgi:hypothetical protein